MDELYCKVSTNLSSPNAIAALRASGLRFSTSVGEFNVYASKAIALEKLGG